MRRVVVLAGVVVLLAAGLASCERAERPAEVVAYFTDAGDLVEGSQVQISDVEVGRVTGIRLVVAGGRMVARVEMEVDPGANVRSGGMRAVVRQTSLLGEQFVQLVPGTSGPPLSEAQRVTIPASRTDRRTDVESFLTDLAAFVGQGGIEDLNRFTHVQALILQDRGETFGRVIDELEAFTGVLARRKADLGAAVDHLASAAGTVAANRATLNDFVDSLAEANALLAEQAGGLRRLFAALSRFGRVNARFLARHERGIARQIRALRPVLDGVARVRGELASDLDALDDFVRLFGRSFGTGPGGRGAGDYLQAEAVLCETLSACHTRGERGDVPGQGSGGRR